MVFVPDASCLAVAPHFHCNHRLQRRKGKTAIDCKGEQKGQCHWLQRVPQSEPSSAEGNRKASVTGCKGCLKVSHRVQRGIERPVSLAAKVPQSEPLSAKGNRKASVIGCKVKCKGGKKDRS